LALGVLPQTSRTDATNRDRARSISHQLYLRENWNDDQPHAESRIEGIHIGLAVLLLNLLPGLVGAIPGISSAVKQIITDVSGSASAVLASGSISSPSVNTVLAAWLGVINALKNDPSLPQDKLNLVLQLEKAVQAALLNDVQASAAVDWTKIVTIATV